MHRIVATTAVCAGVVAVFLGDFYFASLRPEEVTPDEDSFLSVDQVGDREAPRQSVPPEVEFAPANRVDEGPQE